MNTGIQDMVNLCWKLALVLKGRGRPELLDTYEAERLPIITQLVRTTERATQLFNSTNWMVHQLLSRTAPPPPAPSTKCRPMPPRPSERSPPATARDRSPHRERVSVSSAPETGSPISS